MVKAIVKSDDGAQRAARNAGIEANHIARCGYAPRGCRGVVGFLKYKPLVNADGDVSRGWCLVHPEKYRGNEKTGYVVLRPDHGRRARSGERIGARPMPDRLHLTSGAVASPQSAPRMILGQVPLPPCVVTCPLCGTPNWVESPHANAAPTMV